MAAATLWRGSLAPPPSPFSRAGQQLQQPPRSRLRLWGAPASLAAPGLRSRQVAACAQAGPDRQPPHAAVAWEQQRQDVAAFAAQHGRLPRAAGTKARPLAEGEQALGRWCADQLRRRDGSMGPALSAAERTALEAIPGWEWARKGRERVGWEQRCQQVAAFEEQHGRLPRRTGIQQLPLLAGERQLGVWSDNQRRRWKKTRTPPLSARELAALEAIPGWWWEQWSEVPWEERLQQVAAFVAHHNRLPRMKGSQQLVVGEQQLGSWCKTQRQRRKGKMRPLLSQQQEAALEAIVGWYWDDAELWERQRQAVAAFVQQHGRLPGRKGGIQSQHLLPGEQQLGMWCSNQRQRRKGNVVPPLSAEQQAALEDIAGWEWVMQETWEQRLEQLETFMMQHGRLPRRKGSQDKPLLPGEKQLGAWCANQRQQWRGKRKPALSPEQQAALEAIPGWQW